MTSTEKRLYSVISNEGMQTHGSVWATLQEKIEIESHLMYELLEVGSSNSWIVRPEGTFTVQQLLANSTAGFL